MKICIECGRELFNYDNKCDKCSSTNIISKNEYDKIVLEINDSSFLRRNKLMQNDKYKKIYALIQRPKEYESIPEILRYNDNQIEYDDAYWERVKNHTINKQPEQSQSNIPKCPTCGSTNISKIGTFNRMLSTGLFGLASGKIGKTMRCRNCGMTW